LLYLFLILASDRHGLSFYSYDSICSLLQITADQYVKARNGLMDKNLIAFDGTLFQVLDLPAKPIRHLAKEPAAGLPVKKTPEAIRNVIRQSFKGI